MSIIVTGATGNFGRQAVDRLLERVPASELILITRKPENLGDYAERGATVRHGNFDDPATLKAAFAGGRRMLLISTSRVGRRVGQHRNAIEAAVAAGVEQIAYTSFVGIGPANPAIVIADHMATEEILKTSGTAYTILRDSQYSEAVVMMMAPLAYATGGWTSSSGDGAVAFVSRADCAACAAVVLTSPGHENCVYNLTGPDLLSYRQVAAMVAEITGKPLEFRAVDDAEMQAMFDAAGVQREATDDPLNPKLPWSSDDMVTFERAVREGHFAVISDDVRTLLGRPPMALRDILVAAGDALTGGAS